MKLFVARFLFNALTYGIIMFLMDWFTDSTKNVWHYLFMMLFFGLGMAWFNHYTDKWNKKHS